MLDIKVPKTTRLDIPELTHASQHLSSKGQTKISNNNLFYLDIDDAYIHHLFPLLKDQKIKKPDYFGPQSAGAHITIVYPEEGKSINKEDLKQDHHFLIKNAVIAEIGPKKYYVLLVESSSLLQLRKKYQLPDLLCFKGYSIGFHITIGVMS
jgi:hypothetical protein